MFTNTKFVLSVAIMLGTASVAAAAPQYPTDRQAGRERSAPSANQHLWKR